MSDAPTAVLGSRIPRKAKTVLDRLVGSRTMTQSGMEWLICATDPFHDDRVRMPGYPDMNTVNAVVQTFTTTTNIQAPPSQAAPWDLHVPFIPVSPPLINPLSTATDNHLYSISVRPNGDDIATSVTTPLFAGWNAIAVPVSGQDWASSGTGVVSSGALSLPAKYASGHYRLIGAGIEAVNTTADLYKGGSVTCYRAPSTTQDTFVSFASVPRVPYPATVVSLPPSTQAEAAVYTDSRTWAAEDGAYVVNTQCDIENPYLMLTPSEVLVRKALDSTTVQSNITTGTPVTCWTSWQSTPNGYGTSCCAALPFDTVGFIMAGLHQSSTIQLTVRYFIERIPATSEPDLLSMAQVPPAHDAVALEIYSRCLAEMPVGVPVSENPLGEWFASVLDSIKSVAPKLGGIVSGVGRAISEIGGPAPVQSNATPERKQTKAQKAAVKNAAHKGAPPSYEEVMAQKAKAAKRKAARARKRAAAKA